MRVLHMSFIMDYTQSIETVIQLLRDQNYIHFTSGANSDKFPPRSLSAVLNCSAKLFITETNMSSEEIIQAMNDYGGEIMVPVGFAELLQFFKTNPIADFPVVALGSSWKNEKQEVVVPVFQAGDSEWGVVMYSYTKNWPANFAFLAVPLKWVDLLPK